MTITYDATGRTCFYCGADVEDYKGHRDASERTACDVCYPEIIDDANPMIDVIHCIPRKDDADNEAEVAQ